MGPTRSDRFEHMFRENYAAVRGYALRRAPTDIVPDVVFLSGLLDNNGGRVIEDLRSRLPGHTALLVNDGFLPISQLFASAGKAARGTYVSVPELPVERLPQEGRNFVAQFAAGQAGRVVHPQSVYAAQSAEVLLDAIAASNGTRRSVVAALHRVRLRRGILGDVAFDAAGDPARAPVAILRARHGRGAQTVLSTEGADVIRVIQVPAWLRP